MSILLSFFLSFFAMHRNWIGVVGQQSLSMLGQVVWCRVSTLIKRLLKSCPFGWYSSLNFRGKRWNGGPIASPMALRPRVRKDPTQHLESLGRISRAWEKFAVEAAQAKLIWPGGNRISLDDLLHGLEEVNEVTH